MALKEKFLLMKGSVKRKGKESEINGGVWTTRMSQLNLIENIKNY